MLLAARRRAVGGPLSAGHCRRRRDTVPILTMWQKSATGGYLTGKEMSDPGDFPPVVIPRLETFHMGNKICYAYYCVPAAN